MRLTHLTIGGSCVKDAVVAAIAKAPCRASLVDLSVTYSSGARKSCDSRDASAARQPHRPSGRDAPLHHHQSRSPWCFVS